MTKRFEDVEFPDEYPRQEVAEHEVLMTFKGDKDAVYFREWWWTEGAKMFESWRKRCGS